MSNELVPADFGPIGETAVQPWQEPRSLGSSIGRSPLERPVAAIRRYKWLMLGVVVVTTALGAAATKFVVPQYEVQAKIMLTTDSPGDRTGPIRSPGLLPPDDWSQLLRSFTISDAVVRQLAIYLYPKKPDDLDLMKGFSLGDKGRAGEYELDIHGGRHRWTLILASTGVAIDSGAVADSVGRIAGFQWVLPAWAFNEPVERTVRFTV